MASREKVEEYLETIDFKAIYRDQLYKFGLEISDSFSLGDKRDEILEKITVMNIESIIEYLSKSVIDKELDELIEYLQSALYKKHYKLLSAVQLNCAGDFEKIFDSVLEEYEL